MASVAKRVGVALLVILFLMGVFGLLGMGLKNIGLGSTIVGVFSLVGILIAIVVGVITIFNERARRIFGGLLMVLYGIPMALLPVVFIFYRATGRTIPGLEDYTFLSQLIIVFALFCFGGYFVMEGIKLFRNPE